MLMRLGKCLPCQKKSSANCGKRLIWNKTRRSSFCRGVWHHSGHLFRLLGTTVGTIWFRTSNRDFKKRLPNPEGLNSGMMYQIGRSNLSFENDQWIRLSRRNGSSDELAFITERSSKDIEGSCGFVASQSLAKHTTAGCRILASMIHSLSASAYLPDAKPIQQAVPAAPQSPPCVRPCQCAYKPAWSD